MEVAGFAHDGSFKLAVVHLDIQRFDEHRRRRAPSAHNYAVRYDVTARRSDIVLDCPANRSRSVKVKE